VNFARFLRNSVLAWLITSAFLHINSEVAVADDIDCIGPANADTYFIYLHGMDTQNLSHQEHQNRAVLNELAAKMNIRIALPRAVTACPTNGALLCWGWTFDQAELESALPRILAAGASCFPENAPFGVIGFSNGGYFVNSWFLNVGSLNHRTPFAMISIGSDFGDLPAAFSRSSPVGGTLSIVIGKNDEVNRDPHHVFFSRLRDLNIPVKLYEFDGAHEINSAALEAALRVTLLK